MCTGYEDLAALLAAGNQRMYVSFGKADTTDNLALAGKDSEKDTGPVSPSGGVLVVTRLSPGGTCHVGYVDARTNQDANELARKIADERARDFRCGKDKPVVVGKTDPDLAMPKGD